MVDRLEPSPYRSLAILPSRVREMFLLAFKNAPTRVRGLPKGSCHRLFGESVSLRSVSYNKMPSTGSIPVLKFRKLTEKAHTPVKGSDFAAGYDLKSAYNLIVPSRGKALVMTDIQIAVPDGCYGRVAPRSGLAWKNHIDIGAGVVDSDYRGNVGVVMFNHGPTDFVVNEGDRVAQLICEVIRYPVLEEVDVLPDSIRGEGGFGSTGVN